jgi:O-antigen ligase
VPVLLLCLAGANLGLSRTGVILAGVLAVFVAGYGWVRGWHSLTASARVNLVALLLGAGGVVYFVVAGMGEGSIRKEFTLKATVPGEVNSLQDRINIELGRRPLLVRAAIRIWREHPWVGVGGWGYKYLLAEQVPESHWGFLASKGWANVHFDFLQFLAEFGVVGCVFLLGALGVMARDLFRRSVPRNALWVMGLAGLGLVLVFSAIDLPFRSPAILYTWVAILAALPAASGPGTERASCRTPPGLATTSNGHQGILAERTSI